MQHLWGLTCGERPQEKTDYTAAGVGGQLERPGRQRVPDLPWPHSSAMATQLCQMWLCHGHSALPRPLTSSRCDCQVWLWHSPTTCGSARWDCHKCDSASCVSASCSSHRCASPRCGSAVATQLCQVWLCQMWLSQMLLCHGHPAPWALPGPGVTLHMESPQEETGMENPLVSEGNLWACPKSQESMTCDVSEVKRAEDLNTHQGTIFDYLPSKLLAFTQQLWPVWKRITTKT